MHCYWRRLTITFLLLVSCFTKFVISFSTRPLYQQRSLYINTQTVLFVQPDPVKEEAATSTAVKNDNMRVLTGIRDFVDDYDVYILDMWGVMHDGIKPYDGVIDAVCRLKQAGKRLIVLSNSSKRRDDSIKALNKLGFDADNNFDQVVTSGEVAYNMLSGSSGKDFINWNILSNIVSEGSAAKKAFLFGNGLDDEEYMKSCGWSIVPMKEANLIVARGTFTISNGFTVITNNLHDDLYENEMHKQLTIAASRRIPMLICNPDKVRPDSDLSPMPGKIGDDYEVALGGGIQAEELVKRIGKPLVDVYDLALSDFSDRSRACMIGDALETDVTGGSAAGIDTVWVIKDGIHAHDFGPSSVMLEDATRIVNTFNSRKDTYAKGRQLAPDIIIPHLRW